MPYVSKIHRAYAFAALAFCGLGLVAPYSGVAQTPHAVVPISAEPDHKIRFDNGRVRMYEVVLAKGKATLMHEHRADSFVVFFRTGEFTNEPYGEGKPVVVNRTSGAVGFASTAKGPYSHRVIASVDATFHVIAVELLAPAPSSSPAAVLRPGSAFKVALENPRGRSYRVSLAPGESTPTFTRPAGTALFAISAGRISETPEGKPMRLWDFDPANFRWFDTTETLSMRNDGPTPVELVEIEVF